jgi:hypothetical protein
VGVAVREKEASIFFVVCGVCEREDYLFCMLSSFVVICFDEFFFVLFLLLLFYVHIICTYVATQ